jgi:hypothetical protein
MSGLVRVYLKGGGPSDGRNFVALKTASKLQEKCVNGAFFWMYLSVYAEGKAAIYCEEHPRFSPDKQVPNSLALSYCPSLLLNQIG